MRVLLFSDPHLSGSGAEIAGQNTDIRLSHCLEHAAHHMPDARHTIFAGDLADDGAVAGYRHLKALMEGWHTPVTLLMGNEDDRDVFGSVFPDVSRKADGRFASVLRFGEHALFCLDSLDPEADPKHSGRLGAKQLDWLAAEFRDSNAAHKTVILHHPPVSLGLSFFDRIGLRDGPNLCEVMENAGVDLCLSGHVHRAVATTHGGLAFKTLPSTGFGLVLGKSVEDVSADPSHVPGYTILHLGAEGPAVENVAVPC